MAAATVTETSNFHRGDRLIHASSPATLVNTTLTHEINVSGIERLFVQLIVAAAALTGFSISAKPTIDATASVLYSVATDFTSPTGLIVGASGDITTQGVGTGWFIMDTRGLESITLTATSAGSATVALQAGGV